MNLPTFRGALVLVAFGCCASAVSAQPMGLGWAYDAPEGQRPLQIVSASNNPRPRVTLVSGLPEKSFGKDVQTTWVVDPDDIPKFLKFNRGTARGLLGKSGGTELVLVYPRDFAITDREQVAKQVMASAKPKDGQLTFVVVRAGETEPSIKHFREADDLGSAFLAGTPKDGPPCRCLVFEQTVMLFVTPIEAEKTRKDAVLAFVEAYKPRVKELGNARDKEAAKAAAKKVSDLTMGFFRDLGKQILINDRIQAYEALWSYQIGPALASDPQDMKLFASLERFPSNLTGALDKKTCTVEVFSMPDGGASIRYAKAADAARGVFMEHPKPTLDTFELERANYIFQTFRAGKKTGEKESVDCTKEKQLVIIDEKK